MNPFSLAAFDPRSKIILLICVSTLAMSTPNNLWLGLLLVFTCLVLLLGGVDFFRIMGQLRAVFVVLLSLFVIQCLFVRTGAPFISCGDFTLVTWGGFSLALTLTLRLLIIIASALIVLTGEPRDYLLALAQWKLPYEIVFMVMVAIHFIPILREEALNVFYTVQLRGTELQKTPVCKKLRVFIRIALPIMACALNRVKAMSISMEAKAFRAYPKRTYMRRLVLQTKDKLVLFFFPLATAFLLFYAHI